MIASSGNARATLFMSHSHGLRRGASRHAPARVMCAPRIQCVALNQRLEQSGQPGTEDPWIPHRPRGCKTKTGPLSARLTRNSIRRPAPAAPTIVRGSLATTTRMKHLFTKGAAMRCTHGTVMTFLVLAGLLTVSVLAAEPDAPAPRAVWGTVTAASAESVTIAPDRAARRGEKVDE